MKTHTKRLLIISMLLAVVQLARAQTFTTLHSFNAATDGSGPQGVLVLQSNVLYGTTESRGAANGGTIFSVTTNGDSFTVMHSFTSSTDGSASVAGLTLANNILYGVAQIGGSGNNGTMFAINTDGTGFIVKHAFSASVSNTNSEGANPQAGMVLVLDRLFGGAAYGGALDEGAIFNIRTNGGMRSGYTFTGGSDGASPMGALIFSGGTLYGTASTGSGSYGTVFSVSTNGTSFTTLHTFTGATGPNLTNNDGIFPETGLVLSGNTLYGTASQGGSAGHGTLFSVNTDGTGFTVLHTFTGGSDGASPHGDLILANNTLYGTASSGGVSNNGTIFSIYVNGTGFTVLHTFTDGSDGGNPWGGLLLTDNTLYGSTIGGGSYGAGTVYSLTLAVPTVNILSKNNQNTLVWPLSGGNFVLQATTNLSNPDWTTISNATPAVAVTVTNTTPAIFYRLQPQ